MHPGDMLGLFLLAEAVVVVVEAVCMCVCALCSLSMLWACCSRRPPRPRVT
jgi:hypothetical protein